MLLLSGQFYVVCSRCKLTPKPGYFAIILQNGQEHFQKGNLEHTLIIVHWFYHLVFI